MAHNEDALLESITALHTDLDIQHVTDLVKKLKEKLAKPYKACMALRSRPKERRRSDTNQVIQAQAEASRQTTERQGQGLHKGNEFAERPVGLERGAWAKNAQSSATVLAKPQAGRPALG